ncbi:FGGY-family carbohydrate kinase [uncultured Treponema sp.]|uniref:FGGY-family carbohydrate kinase n=1 Tax=uncultured Treponema sp. TaxID=162155 RepID=UPI002593051E|nr:FGGY-family carbohydrate kinase [uncultured Treponema sp.]
MEQTVLAVDIGTSSLKAAFVSEKGKISAFSRRPFFLCNTEHASKEWLPAFQNALQDLVSQSPEIRPSGICVSGNGPTLVAQSGETLLWNEKVVQLKSTSLFIPRLLAFKDKFSDVWKKSGLVYSGPEYFLWLLTGESCTILPEKRFESAYWNKQLLLESGFSNDEINKLPSFTEPSHKVAGLSRKASSFLGVEEFGIKEGLPVFCGSPDFISALIGTATVKPGILCDRAGSSEGINFCTAVPLEGEKIRTLPSVVPELWNASVLLPDSGSKFDSFKLKIERELGKQIEYSVLVQEIIESDGTNASLDQGKYLMIQTALNLKDAIEILKDAAAKKGVPFPDEMRVAGGQAKSALWNQMKADITGMKISVPSCPDAELLGDAAFAFTALKVFSSLTCASESLFSKAETFYPQNY